MPSMDLITFLTRWFYGDEYKGCQPMRLVSIYDLRVYNYSTGNKLQCQVVADMKLFMKHVERVVVLVCAWEHDTMK